MVEEKGKRDAGKKQGRKPWTLREFGGKAVWDWLDLLIVPAVLVLIGGFFALVQDYTQTAREDLRARHEDALAEQRAQDEALQAYLDQMSTLLLEKDLRKSGENSEVRTLARARTLTALRRVDTSRKEEIMQFLLEANLLQGEYVVVQAESGPVLLAPVLQLHHAPLGETDLSEASLVGANLSGANLSGVNLSDAQVTNQQLEAAKSLKGATMPNGQKYEDWLKDKNAPGKDEQNE